MIPLAGSFVVLLSGAFLAVLLGRRPRAGLLVGLLAMTAGAGLYIAAALAVLLWPGASVETLTWRLPLGEPTLAIDGLSAWFLLAIGALSIAVATYAWPYMTADEDHATGSKATSFGALLCLLVAAMGLVVCAADVMLFLVGWELMSLVAFFLVSFHDQGAAVRRGAWVYLIATHIGTALFLLPMFAILIAHGGWNFAAIGAAVSGLGTHDPGLAILLFAFGLVGFGTKAGLMPMHVWLPIAHPVAPTPVSALLSGIVVKTGIYGLLRLLTFLGPLPASCGTTMIAIGVISGVLGVLYAIAQHDIKRLLAYHTVENIGIIAVGIGIGMLGQTTGHPVIAAIGYAGALLHVLNHALFKGLLFLSAGAVIHAAGTGEIDRLGGLIKKTPWNAALFLLAAVAICGLPPLNGFISEWLIYGSLFGGTIHLPYPLPGMAVVGAAGLALMGGLALACFAKVFSVVFLGEPREKLPVHPTPRLMLTGMAILGLLCLAIGLAPSIPIGLTAPAAAKLLNAPLPTVTAATDHLLAPAVMLGALAAMLLALIALLMLLRRVAGRGQPIVAAASGEVPTWGCGYTAPSARMQYTASSFAWSLIHAFRRLLWPQRHLVAPAGVFPADAALYTHTADIAESDLFSPLFKGTARVAAMVRTVSLSGQPAAEIPEDDEHRRGPILTALADLLAAIRHGRIQMCLVYIAATLVLVFLIEAAWQPRSRAAAPRPVAATQSSVTYSGAPRP